VNVERGKGVKGKDEWEERRGKREERREGW